MLLNVVTVYCYSTLCYCTLLLYIMLLYVMLLYIVTIYYVTLRYVTYIVTVYYVTLRYVTVHCYCTLCCPTLCYCTLLLYIMLLYVMLLYIMLLYTMLLWIMLLYYVIVLYVSVRYVLYVMLLYVVTLRYVTVHCYCTLCYCTSCYCTLYYFTLCYCILCLAFSCPLLKMFSHWFAFLILDHVYNTSVERASSNHTDIYRTTVVPAVLLPFQCYMFLSTSAVRVVPWQLHVSKFHVFRLVIIVFLVSIFTLLSSLRVKFHTKGKHKGEKLHLFNNSSVTLLFISFSPFIFQFTELLLPIFNFVFWNSASAIYLYSRPFFPI